MPSQLDPIHNTASLIEQVRNGLIVSCQALPHEPLFGAEIMAKMALAAALGGAKAIRANTPVDIAAIRNAVELPIIGLWKVDFPGFPVYITPTLQQAQAVAEAGADIIAIDATNRPRPQLGSLADFIQSIHQKTGKLVLADVATHEEGIAAEAAGADMISTTMSGYTDESPKLEEPDLELVCSLAKMLGVPLFAEGRYRTPEQVKQALEFGATAVIVGGAITRPLEITKWFVAEVEKGEFLAEAQRTQRGVMKRILALNELSGIIIDCAIKVHKRLGPGLLESVYEAALEYELKQHGLFVRRQVEIPVIYESVKMNVGFRADLVVEERIIVELKSLEKMAPVHKKILLTYLKVADKRLGLLLNFGEEMLKDGITRVVNGLIE